MGLFTRRPKTVICFFCHDAVEQPAIITHYRDHLIEVTDNNGLTAYTFECPKCGMMDLAWGGGKPDPRGVAAVSVAGHLIERHRIMTL